MTNSELQKSREILASLTVGRLQTPEGKNDFDQAAGKYIRDKIRKTSLFYEVIPPQFVTEDNLVDIPGNTTGEQPDIRCFMPSVQLLIPKPVTAMLMNMRGEPVPEYIYDKPQLPIPMRTVETKWFKKTTDELLASGILKVVEEMASWEAKERDRKFMKYCELVVAQSGQVLRENGPLQRDHFRKIQHPAQKNEIEPKVVLMSERAFTDPDSGDPPKKASGMTCYPIETALSDTFDNGAFASTNIWSFPAPEFLGYNLYCGGYKVWSQWERADLWSFQGREMIGAGIGNINGITKLTIAASRRLGFMAGEIKVPDDFDSMGGPEIEKMFEEDE